MSRHATRVDARRSSSRDAVECAWCRSPFSPTREGNRFCSQRCRQAGNRFRVVSAASTSGATRMRFGYGDPPYPGKAERYYGMPEVDHGELVLRLVRDFPDGWALSTSRRALLRVARMIPDVLDPQAYAWDHLRSRGGASWGARLRWEALIVVGGRPRLRAAREGVDDLLAYGGRQRSHPGALVGMKPAPFWSWLFELLGAVKGDELVELFPGSGAGARAWALFQGDDVASHAAGGTRRDSVDARSTTPRSVRASPSTKAQRRRPNASM